MSQPDETTAPNAADPQTLLDPPQIEAFIREYFHAQPAQGDQLWSLIQGNDDLLRAWDSFATADNGERFWRWWASTVPLEDHERTALREMRDD